MPSSQDAKGFPKSGGVLPLRTGHLILSLKMTSLDFRAGEMTPAALIWTAKAEFMWKNAAAAGKMENLAQNMQTLIQNLSAICFICVSTADFKRQT